MPTFDTCHSHSVDDVCRETKRNLLGNFERSALASRRSTSASCLADADDTLTLSKRQLKSTWTVSPVVPSSRMFSQWRSPSLSPTENRSAARHVSACRVADVPENEPNHRDDGRGAGVCQASAMPRRRLREVLQEPVVEDWREAANRKKRISRVARQQKPMGLQRTWPSLLSRTFLQSSSGRLG